MRRQALPVLGFVMTAWAFAPAHAISLSCLGPVPGVTWLRWEAKQQTLDAWCESVGPPVFRLGPERTGAVSRLLVVSWNSHVGGGDLEELISEVGGLENETGLVLLLRKRFAPARTCPNPIPAA